MMLYPVSEAVTINVKQVRFFKYTAPYWEVHFDERSAPMRITEDQYADIMAMCMDKEEPVVEREVEGTKTLRVVFD